MNAFVCNGGPLVATLHCGKEACYHFDQNNVPAIIVGQYNRIPLYKCQWGGFGGKINPINSSHPPYTLPYPTLAHASIFIKEPICLFCVF